ncbi:MAG TPA: UDP-N-acetylmuramate--L-alanine ligase [Patescibacteria group bacterium]|nr:UDP-N-acetylmuramate--L-alanine ligase [Patescibacteria group bacterium]
MTIEEAHCIHLVGVKGVAMANFAVILKKMGKQVSGSDVSDEFITDNELIAHDISVSVGFGSLPPVCDMVIYSGAHEGSNNPQVIEAKKKSIPLYTQAQALGELTTFFKNPTAVCGTHGKTTTSSLLSHFLIKAGKSPSYLVGAPKFGDFWGGDYQKGEYFIIEADEYGVSPPIDKTPKFHFLHPLTVIMTSVDFDHPDVFDDIDAVKKAFSTFLEKKEVQKVIACIDDENIHDILSRCNLQNVISYGFSKEADFRIITSSTQHDKTIFTASYRGRKPEAFSLSLCGKHNILNAASIIVWALQNGFDLETIKNGIGDFVGAQRRFQKIGEVDGVLVFDDYAHHPREIAATIAGARSRFPGKRIIVIFQPHTYSRTKALLEDFIRALSFSDLAVIAPIFASQREQDGHTMISQEDLREEIHKKGIQSIHVLSYGEIKKFIETHVKKGDVVFTMGAGDIYKLASDIISLCAQSTKV